MKKIPLQWLIIGLGVILYLIHFTERDPSDPYSRPIVSDAKGYYAYLPAVFIYQDLDYEFMPEMDQKYYAVGQDKHIFIEVDGERVNKTFPGVALLYLPFFLIAHFLALLFGLEADGYSLIYQYLFDFGQFFYATLGLLFAGKFLEHFFSNKLQIFLSILVIALGTNFWFYTVYDQSVTHIYNFCLISGMFYLLIRFEKEHQGKFLVLSATVLAILLIVRPTGMLSLLLVPFFFKDRLFYINVWRFLKQPKVLLLTLFFGGFVFAIPLVLWNAQSGNWIVYSYGKEGFNFMQPHAFEFLFSYAKGWWLYSPLVLVSLVFGGTVLTRTGEMRKLVFLLVFIGLAVYVFSSWWCWYYGFSFGQRVMVDFSILYIYLFALVWSKWKQSLMIGVSPIFLFLIFLNIHQSHQHHNGYYSTPTPTSEMYWDNFLNFQKKAKVYFDQNEVKAQFEIDFEGEDQLCSGQVEHNEARSGDYLIYVDQEHQFSGNIEIVDELILDRPLIISAYIKAENDITQTNLIVEHHGLSNTYRYYPLHEFVKKGEWVKVQFLYENEYELSNDHIHIYFWNQNSADKIYIDDVEIFILD